MPDVMKVNATERMPSLFKYKSAAVMFYAGMGAMLAQVLLTRELMVVFYGNELALGTMFAAWLISAGAGSLLARPFLHRLGARALRNMLAGLLVILAVCPLALIFAARAIRAVFDTPAGEYMPPAQMAAAAFLVLAPAGMAIGMIFPAACRMAAEGGKTAGIYAAESAGGMVAGIIFSFLLVHIFTPPATALIAAVCALCGAVMAAPAGALRTTCASGILLAALCLIWPPANRALEDMAVRQRWKAFGIISGPVPEGVARAALVSTRDSRHQNLALFRSDNQFTLYGNGKVMFSFPDASAAEQKASFIMAQNPAAKKILLIGGNPADDPAQLLKYPLEKLTLVEMDAQVFRMLSEAGPAAGRQAAADPRLEIITMDAPRFVRQAAGSKMQYDIAIIEAPEPATLAMNRLYTLEFYAGLSRILAPGGFMCAALDSSENLGEDTARLAASIHRALSAVFPQVLATGGTRKWFFAGGSLAPLTFDGRALYERWKSSGIKTKYFQPEYFLSADEINAGKTSFVVRRLSETAAPANTALKPVAAFYSMALWGKYSGGRFGRLPEILKELPLKSAAGALGAVFALALLLLANHLRRPGKHAPALRAVTAAAIAATGFTGMALELILIFAFQSFLGYIYSSIGVLIAMYMLGLALGAKSARRCAGAEFKRRLQLMIGLEVLLALVALGVPVLMKWGGNISAETILAGAIYAIILLAGWAGGAQFILAVNMPGAQGAGSNPEEARNAALMNAVDLGGAALGGISVGAILLPLFGIGGTCFLLAMLKAGTGLLLVAAARKIAARG